VLPGFHLAPVNKVFSLNFDMENTIPSTFLGNIECKIFKQMKNSGFHSSNYLLYRSIDIDYF